MLGQTARREGLGALLAEGPFRAARRIGRGADRFAERTYGPTTNGPLAKGGIDREELRQAVHTYYAMMGWDPETGIPLPGKLAELDVAWAGRYL